MMDEAMETTVKFKIKPEDTIFTIAEQIKEMGNISHIVKNAKENIIITDINIFVQIATKNIKVEVKNQ